MFSVGDTVGDYEIVAKLRSGGMATLFLGRRLGAAGFNKHVAIKIVHEHLAEDPNFVAMFVDEALLVARIQHPNVVHVEELREVEGRHFLVMEYVYGGSLFQLLGALLQARRGLNPTLAAHIAIKLADGLHAAHETTDDQGELLGVVHRDVTPQNVLIAYGGNVKLIDFGVAKSKGRSRETQQGSIKGKFRYLAPEQAFARPVDRRTDIYQLGIVLWEMLTMRQRFDGKSDANVLNEARYPDAIPPSIHTEDVPPALDDVVLKAMAADPAERFQSAHEFRNALVKAMPEAGSLHESVLGKLLRMVLPPGQQEGAIPESVPGALRTPTGEVSARLEDLTVSVGGVVPEGLADDRTDPSIQPEVKTQLIDVSGEFQVDAPTVPPPAFAPPPGPAVAAQRARGGPPLVFAVIFAVLLAVAGLMGGALVVLLLWPEDTPTPAVSLPPVTEYRDPTPTSAPDAGLTDAGLTDAGLTDAGLTDAGLTDSGPEDAGPPDSGPVDAGAAMGDPPVARPPPRRRGRRRARPTPSARRRAARRGRMISEF